MADTRKIPFGIKLFDEFDRNYEGPSPYAESKFRFLNRSANPTFSKVRQTLEEWFSLYPAIEQKELLTRFRSNNDSHHLSAFFELFLHELLLRLKCRVEIHPTINNATKKKTRLSS